jgi:nicotinate-nucleotide pyrophosphorylase (carboxylating)
VTQRKTPAVMLEPLPPLAIEPLVRAALAEDFGRAGDITTEATVPADHHSRVALRARQAGRVAGLDLARMAFRLLDPEIRIAIAAPDGSDVAPGDTIAALEGRTRSILSAERVALNYLGHLSGIATLTCAYVTAVEGAGAHITCTRKTTPGLRALEKYAVRAGGGVNHRFGLDDAVLIKDNHIAAAGGVVPALKAARARVGHLVKIEIEVDTLDQLDEVLAIGADAVLLDNMDTDTLREAVRRIDGRLVAEASGGVTLESVRAIAEAGVDLISVGALTHSAPCLDIGLDFEAVV